MGQLLDTTARYLNGEVPEESFNPMGPLMAWEEVAPRTAFVSSFANVTAFDTDAGLVLIDTGSFFLAAQVHTSLREWTTREAHTAVFTHGHVDHVFGTERYESERAERGLSPLTVVAHRRVPARFERYRRSPGYNACINARQFRMNVPWPLDYRAPDRLYDDALTLDVGGERFELHHAEGETDDHTWVWAPSRRTVCTGDLFIWATPNAGNPQKLRRNPREWALALRAMQALGAEVLCPGHGLPIVGEDIVRRALDETASVLEHLHDATLAMMNEGASLDEILHSVHAPEHLLARPYLRPVYDEPEFIVRNVWANYGGWYDGDPARLKPAPQESLAREICALAGGVSSLVARAKELAAAGDLRLACHLIEFAAQAEPSDSTVVEARREVYSLRASRESSLMARGVYFDAADSSPRVKRA